MLGLNFTCGCALISCHDCTGDSTRCVERGFGPLAPEPLGPVSVEATGSLPLSMCREHVWTRGVSPVREGPAAAAF